MIVLGKKVLIVKRVIVVVTDNKMTIQSLKNSCTGYNLDKTPGFLQQKPTKIPHNNFAKRSLNNFQKLAKPRKMGVCELVFCLVVLFWY